MCERLHLHLASPLEELFLVKQISYSLRLKLLLHCYRYVYQYYDLNLLDCFACVEV